MSHPSTPSTRPARRRRTAVGAAAGAAALAVVASALMAPAAGAVASAAPDPEPAPVSAPGAPTEHETSACALRPSANRSEHDEWSSCFAVKATLSAAPTVGSTATLSYEITAAVDRPDAVITVETPEILDLAAAVPGTASTDEVQSDGTGRSTFTRTTLDLAAGQTVTGSVPVRAEAAGLAQLTVTVNAPTSYGVDGAADSVFVTVGDQTSRIGGDLPTSGGVLTAPGEPAERTPIPGKVAELGPESQPFSDDPAVAGAETDATSCARGRWSYYDDDGALQPSINYQVQVWDQDSATEDDLLVTGVTNFSGEYDLCFDGADGEGGGQEIYVRFISSNSTWRVRNTAASDDNYVNTTAVQAICDGCVHDYGSLIPGNDIHRGMHAFDSANDMWAWLPHDCWDRDGACRQAVINWTATSTDGTYYSLSANDVHLAADDPNAPHTVVHELTHSTMDDTYEDDYPPIPSCSPHYIQNDSSTGCAWTEGFAEWVPAEVYNDPYYRWPNGAELNLETPTWGTSGWDTGDDVEGRVAGSLIDMTDAANEAYWDRWDESDPGPVWDSFQNRVNDTFASYLTGRIADGYDFASSGARASTYQNTIDYTFRDPLSINSPAVRRAPTPNVHNYGMTTNVTDWSVVALRPASGSNQDLSVYDDSTQATLLKTSAYTGSTTDFIAIDSNHRAVGIDYPRATQGSGTGEYRIEYAGSSGALGQGLTTISMSSTDVVAVRDLALTGGSSTAIRVVPDTGQNPALFVMNSSSSSSSTWIRSRSEALVSSTAGGASAEERVSFTPGTTDTYGFVLLNDAGSGTYDVYVDQSAPTGAMVEIDGGAEKTKTREVTLRHTAADSQTGMGGMRISTDGTMDSEPWITYAGTSEVTLPSGDGEKTVLVQFRNRAYQTTSIVSDTIRLDTRADLTTTSVSKPPKQRERGQSFDVTDEVRNTGTQQSDPTISRYYLSKDKKYSGNDTSLVGQRDVGRLDGGERDEGTTEVTVRGSTPLGKYHVIACADDTKSLGEYSEKNNCTASKKKVKVVASAPVVPGPLAGVA